MRRLARTFAATIVMLAALTPLVHADDWEALRLAAGALRQSQLGSGLFAYDFDFLAGRPTGEDHIARQAGTAWALAEYYGATRDAGARAAVEAALTKLGTLSLPIGKTTAQSAVESVGVLFVPIGRATVRTALERLELLYQARGDGRMVSANLDYGTAHTGATALALLAELPYHRTSRDPRFAALRAAWLRGLLAVRIPGRGFREAPRSMDDTPFADGQGWLALAAYDRSFPGDPSVTSTLRELDQYLMRRYGRGLFPAFYQWGTMAAALRWEATAERRFLEFIADQARRVLDRPQRERDYNTCYEAEGLATAAAVLGAPASADGGLADRLRQRLEIDMDKNRRMQIPPNRGRLEVSDGAAIVSSRLGEFVGAFRAGAFSPYTRIDFTAHCVSAMLRLPRS